jgi:hypothetical protein
MMPTKRRLLTGTTLLVILTGSVNPAQAQLPSGSNPYPPLSFPIIHTPTLIRTPIPVTPTGTDVSGSVPTPTSTSTFVPTITPLLPVSTFDTTLLNRQMLTMQAAISISTSPILDTEGHPIDLTMTTNLADQGTTLLGYIKGLASVNLGFLNPFLQLLLLRFGITLTFNMLGFLVPLGATFVGIMRKIIGVVLDFIPG